VTTTDPNLLTQAAYARSRKDRGLPGGSREAVRRAVDEKRISAFGPDKLVDSALADAQWERNTRTRVSPTAVAGSGASTGTSTAAAPSSSSAAPPSEGPSASEPGYMQFRARREEADAQIAEMNAAKMRGGMLMREDVDRAIYEIGRELRDRLTACGRRIASEVSTLASAEACEAVIDREHRIVLELLASGVREKLGNPVKEAA
jgi:hypothetical protein